MPAYPLPRWAAARLLASLLLLVAVDVRADVGGGCTPAAHVFCVTNTNDTTNTGSPDYAGSLRKAIVDANAAPDPTNRIGFAIPGSGVHTINMTAAQMPAIATDLTVDGFSQPGSVQNTNAPDQGGLNGQLAIEVVGTGGPGFYYDCCAGAFKTLTYQGLVLHGFSDAIIGQQGTLTPKAQINVYGCYVGTKADGTALSATFNGTFGVRIGYDSGQVGGVQAWQRNLISGNLGGGIYAAPGDAATSVVIEGNLIGTDATGTAALPNGTGSGILAGGQALKVRIGCATAGSGCSSGSASRNVIAGNATYGIALQPGGAGSNFAAVEIKGNYIGVGAGGAALPNGYADPQYAGFGGGIQVLSALGNASPVPIGGFGAGEGNVIAHNRGPGINLLNPFNSNPNFADARGNLVHDNAGPAGVNIAIAQFALEEPLANDASDADAGSNNRQNWPEILTAEPVRVGGAAKMRVTYRVRTSPANAAYPLRIDFHYAINGGSGLLLAQDSYPDSAGEGYVTKDLDVLLQVAGPGPWYSFWGPIVALATSASGYGSEISPVTNDWIFGDTFDD